MSGVPTYKKICLTVDEAAEYSGIGQNCIRGLIKDPKCDFILKHGNRTLIKREAFEEFVKRQTKI